MAGLAARKHARKRAARSLLCARITMRLSVSSSAISSILLVLSFGCSAADPTPEPAARACAGKCDSGGQSLEAPRYEVDLDAANRNWNPPTPFTSVEDLFRVRVMLGADRSLVAD